MLYHEEETSLSIFSVMISPIFWTPEEEEHLDLNFHPYKIIMVRDFENRRSFAEMMLEMRKRETILTILNFTYE